MTDIAIRVQNLSKCYQIFEQQGAPRAAYGARLLPRLAESLTAGFGRVFDASNFYCMRLFYLAFPICDSLLIRHELNAITVRAEPVEALEAIHISTSSMRTDSWINRAASS